MKTISLDILEKSQLPASQAKAILRVMEMEFDERESKLATRADLQEAFHRLDLEIARIGDRLSRWVLTCM